MRGGRAWAIEHDGVFAGIVSLAPDLGYWLDRRLHGRGLMTEAVAAVLRDHFARTDQAIVSGYHLGNTPSAAIQARMGFRKTHIEEAVQRATGQIVTIQRTELRRDDWAARCGA